MNLITFLIKVSWVTVLASAIAGSISGIGSASLIALINQSVVQIDFNRVTVPLQLVWSFAGMAGITLVTKLVSQFLLVDLAQGAIYKLRLQISGWILASPLPHLEELGASRLLTTLTEDIQNISIAVSNIPALCINVAIILGCLLYLGRLSGWILLVTLVFLAVAITTVQFLITRVVHLFELAREENDALMKHFRGITDGIKELKLNRHRRKDFLELELKASVAALQKYHSRSRRVMAGISSFGEFLFFILIGLLVFGVPNLLPTSSTVLSGYILTLTYLMPQISSTLAILPYLSQAGVSLRKIDALGLSLASRSEDLEPIRHPYLGFEKIEIIKATYTYRSGEDYTFNLGPVDLSIQPGELIFIVGGNGSGKSTLVKLITGLYTPDTGKIYVNSNLVTNQNREAYRQLFSAVFSEFYLFERLLGFPHDDLDAQASFYLEQLQLAHKVQVRNGSLSTTELSQGQRKRLALLTAYLDDRPIYIFDEWAADQDPFFREVFYRQILAELKQRGKAILVISHDDRYFHLSDRLIKLDYGKIVSIQHQGKRI
ncbi:MAG: ABC transporter ATP-binding protein [Hapalosiphonaceae cyanobacterium JJU2]|nr:MAG: ABC transporter ATP-binding protein [Hapalosiphonaceae cyanobacterium JJU2]